MWKGGSLDKVIKDLSSSTLSMLILLFFSFANAWVDTWPLESVLKGQLLEWLAIISLCTWSCCCRAEVIERWSYSVHIFLQAVILSLTSISGYIT